MTKLYSTVVTSVAESSPAGSDDRRRRLGEVWSALRLPIRPVNHEMAGTARIATTRISASSHEKPPACNIGTSSDTQDTHSLRVPTAFHEYTPGLLAALEEPRRHATCIRIVRVDDVPEWVALRVGVARRIT